MQEIACWHRPYPHPDRERLSLVGDQSSWVLRDGCIPGCERVLRRRRAPVWCGLPPLQFCSRMATLITPVPSARSPIYGTLRPAPTPENPRAAGAFPELILAIVTSVEI